MKAVSNTSLLLFFSKINALELLSDCLEIYVPDAVIVEVRSLALPDTFIRQSVSVQGEGFVEGALGTLG